MRPIIGPGPGNTINLGCNNRARAEVRARLAPLADSVFVFLSAGPHAKRKGNSTFPTPVDLL